MKLGQVGMSQVNSISQSRLADGRTLYVGHLNPYVNETALQELLGPLRPDNIKIIKDKQTGMSAGYGFVQFQTENQANTALQQFNSKLFMGQELKINWAFTSTQEKEESQAHYQIFVGDLTQEVTDGVLKEQFSRVGHVSDARVMMDYYTARSKGYGFVSFKNKDEAQKAIDNMNGQQIGSRKVRCSWAQHKQETAIPQDFESIDKFDTTNSNVYVGNVPPELTEADLKKQFTGYGPIAECKMHKKGGYAFIRYQNHNDAVNAIFNMNGKPIPALNGKALKCSWGKNTLNQMPNMYGLPQVGNLMNPNALMARGMMQNPLMMHQNMIGAYNPGMNFSQGASANLGSNLNQLQMSQNPTFQNPTSQIMDPSMQYYGMYAYQK